MDWQLDLVLMLTFEGLRIDPRALQSIQDNPRQSTKSGQKVWNILTSAAVLLQRWLDALTTQPKETVMSEPQLVESVPCFQDLCDIRQSIKECEDRLLALADSPADVVNRAGELLTSVADLMDLTQHVLVQNDN